ncbi:PIG-L family deacetylase [Mesorhizobium sp.]|uniref:PIG-L deacetylase family protein n=1 Tax=Mesorhizobium sp. TaxID=1871066 RepID=UPI00343FEE76
MWTFRQTFSTMHDSQLRLRLKPFEVGVWSASAVIVAPHPDDETLDCGGVAAKRLPRLPRSVWFLSSMAPRRDPRHPETLRMTREAGAIEAVLGASSESVTFLHLPGGAANHHVHEITHVVVSMLKSWRPQSVFKNYAKDSTSDHVAVNAAVRAALRA